MTEPPLDPDHYPCFRKFLRSKQYIPPRTLLHRIMTMLIDRGPMSLEVIADSLFNDGHQVSRDMIYLALTALSKYHVWRSTKTGIYTPTGLGRKKMNPKRKVTR